MTQGRVVVVGDALIDEMRDDLGVREFVGGAALNVAVGVARLGIPTTLIAMVGDDDAGARIRAYLADFDVELLATPSPLGTSRAVSERAGGAEPVYVFNAAAQARRIRFGDVERAAIADAPMTVVSCFPFDDAAQAAEFATAVHGSSTRLVIDPNPRTGMMRDLAEFVAGFEDLAPRASLVKIGDDDAHLMFGESLDDSAERMRELGVPIVLGTRGADGAFVRAVALGDDELVAPIADLPGRVVDTMGAGDATLSAVVARLAQDGEPRDAEGWRGVLDEAMLIAATTCRFEGALLRTPSELRGVDLDSLGT
ncbi:MULTISPECIES: carbohydrate kinase family protein [unclassified Microbacterium]|uniref:carbohydrate kinase family protein n=1 Tax=unclassified Microbacterium TaxID=2609290 RepID=UPI000C2B6EED|nr:MULTISPECIES: PfkB family carbohydrate kinase [unclassified Microbacterium]